MGGTLGLIYTNVLAQGVSYAFPDYGKKLWKTPFLASLANYEETKNLTLAHLFSLIFLIAAFATWEILLRLIGGDDSCFRRFAQPERMQKVMICVGSAVLAADAFFYYSGITNGSWKGGFSMPAVLATVGFIAVNVAASLFSVFLSPKGYKKEPSDA